MKAEFKYNADMEVIKRNGPILLIFGDYSQFKQVFFNIFKNECVPISGRDTIVIDGLSTTTRSL
jgi:hypothetical protein